MSNALTEKILRPAWQRPQYPGPVDKSSESTDDRDLAHDDTLVTPLGEEDRVGRLLQEKIHSALFGGGAAKQRLGRYVFLDQLGAGGMGVVCAAYDPKLDRKVAIKLIGGSKSASNEARARMLREAQAMARISHPNVVQVYEITEVDGEICVVMEYLKGTTLRDWREATPRSWAEIVAVYAQFADGLAAAHAEGVVHRDVKPDNAIIDDEGRVRVLDFGVARTEAEVDREELRALGESVPAGEHLRTRTGALLGTPAYMPPEQLHGRAVDARSDQFSLCVALFEALYGARPFRGDTWPELFAAVTTGELTAPPVATEVPKWVQAIVVRGLAEEPSARWSSMEALAAELRDDPAVRRRRWAWRGLGAAIAAAAVVAGALAYSGSQEARAAERRAATSVAEAAAVKAESTAALRASYLGAMRSSGYVELDTLDNPLRALVMLSDVYRADPENLDLRELIAVAARPADALEWQLPAGAPAWGEGLLVLGPDGARIGIAVGDTIRIVDTARGEPVMSLTDLGDQVTQLRFSSDGQRIYAVVRSSGVRGWSVAAGEQLLDLPGSGAVAISPDGSLIAQSNFTEVGLIDAVTGETRASLPIQFPVGLTFDRSGERLGVDGFGYLASWDLESKTERRAEFTDRTLSDDLAFQADGVLRYVSLEDGEAILYGGDGQRLKLEHAEPVNPGRHDAGATLVDPQARWAAAVSDDGQLNVWELPSGRWRLRTRVGRVGAGAIALSPDGERIAVGGSDGIARILDVATGTLLARFDGHDAGVLAVGFTPDGEGLITLTRSGALRRWRTGPQGLKRALSGELMALRGDGRALITRDGDRLALIPLDGSATAVDLEIEGESLGAAFSPNGERIAIMVRGDAGVAIELRSGAGTIAGTIQAPVGEFKSGITWDAGSERLMLQGQRGGVTVIDAVARKVLSTTETGPLIRPLLAAGGTRVVAEGFKLPNMLAQLIDADRGEIVAELDAGRGEHLNTDHAGQRFAYTSTDGRPALASIDDGQVLRTFGDPEDPPSPTKDGHPYFFSPDDSILASLHTDASIRLWNVENGALRANITGSRAEPGGLAFDPRGELVVATAVDGTASVWDTTSGELRVTLDPAQVPLGYVEFTADGGRVVADGGDLRARVWSVDSGRRLHTVPGDLSIASAGMYRDGALLTWDHERRAGHVWEVGPEPRTPEAIDALIEERVPWVLEEGQLRPR